MVWRDLSSVGDDVEVWKRGFHHEGVGAFIRVAELKYSKYIGLNNEKRGVRTIALRASPLAEGGSW